MTDIVTAIREHLFTHTRNICRRAHHWPTKECTAGFNDDHVARRCLRIEATRNVWYEILRDLTRKGGFANDPLGNAAKIDGVSLYCVDTDLPEPGWRIVNPFEGDA